MTASDKAKKAPSEALRTRAGDPIVLVKDSKVKTIRYPDGEITTHTK